MCLPPQKTIVLGEFNMVYWSDEIRQFRETTHLRNSRKDVIPASFRAPFDHVFYAEDLQCVALKDLMLSKKTELAFTQPSSKIWIMPNRF